MRITISNNFKWLLAVLLTAYVMFSFHDWYWTVASWIHPDISLRYEEKFSDYSDDQLDSILNERPSSRTNGALRVWQKRHPLGQSFVAWTNTTQGK
jgi:hypothetical protein